MGVVGIALLKPPAGIALEASGYVGIAKVGLVRPSTCECRVVTVDETESKEFPWAGKGVVEEEAEMLLLVSKWSPWEDSAPSKPGGIVTADASSEKEKKGLAGNCWTLLRTWNGPSDSGGDAKGGGSGRENGKGS